ncbi:MAG: hypothetical protein DRN33_04520 [Thermoplasmata archaeon]|nr:MAG: hypothetical protein DRN33_04520 [Thermoplasmata archaeon]
MILAKLSAKDALFTGSGRKYQLIDGPGNILKQLDNGDKVYVHNISINFTELSAQKGWGAWLTAARVLQKECPPGVPSSISVGVTVRNVQSEEGIQLQPRDVKDMVQRMLGHIPGMDASTARSVFGDPLTKAMAVKNSAEVKAELTLYNEEVLDAYNRWKALLGDCMDATAEEITRVQEILAAVLRTIPADFADLELANSILEEAGEKLKEAITDLINDVDMDELEAQLRAVAKDRIERVPSVPIFATPAYHAAISEEYQQRLINIDEVVHSTAHREWAHSLLEEVLGMISKDCNDVDMAIEVLTNATLGIISEYTEEFTPEQRALTSRSVLDAASARLEAAE